MIPENEFLFEKAAELLKPMADLYEPEYYVYFVTCSPDGSPLSKDNLADMGNESFCKKCIPGAVKAARKSYREKANEKWEQFNKIIGDGFYMKGEEKVFPSKTDIDGHNKYLKEKYSRGKIFGYECCNVNEHEDFELCENCGVIFAHGLLLTEQEVDHWETNFEFTEQNLGTPQTCYELSKIFDGEPWAYGHFNGDEKYRSEIEESVAAIAQKVITVLNK